jgi:hypothetical protein
LVDGRPVAAALLRISLRERCTYGQQSDPNPIYSHSALLQ